jgi:hypothetical protein
VRKDEILIGYIFIGTASAFQVPRQTQGRDRARGQSDSKFMSRPPRALTTFRLNSKDGSAALPVSLDGSGKLTGY